MTASPQAATTEIAALPLAREGRLALLPRPLIMGVLNITPDSFSDGGRWVEPGRAVDHALRMLDEGADLIDLGAESTRPGGGVYGTGAREVPAAEELERLLPVLSRLRRATQRPLSVDSRKAVVARRAVAEGADLINDVSALGDPDMAGVVAEAGCAVVLMHSRGELASMQRDIGFRDVVAEVRAELAERADAALAAGIARTAIVLDPGIGFGKTVAQNLELLRRLDLLDLGLPLLIGASRKSFIGALSGAEPDERLAGSLAAVAWAAAHGAAMVRVHDVAASHQFLEVWNAIRDAGQVCP